MYSRRPFVALSLVAASAFVPFLQLFWKHGSRFLVPSYAEVSLLCSAKKL